LDPVLGSIEWSNLVLISPVEMIIVLRTFMGFIQIFEMMKFQKVRKGKYFVCNFKSDFY